MDWTAHLSQVFGDRPPTHLAVAVSGGSDSTALMHILHDWAKARGVHITVLTVDHKLRPDSTAEAAAVASLSATLGLPHVTLTWTGWGGRGNLQDAARRARYRLMAEWVRDNGAEGLVLGHTADDQAETVLMRLSRKAGVDGLSAMEAESMAYGVKLYRPLLDHRRQDLRDWLSARGLKWVDDPSNDELKYDRIKMRQALEVLEPLGVTVEGLSGLAAIMSEARDALNWQTAQAAKDICSAEMGELHIAPEPFDALPAEIKRRLLVKALGWIGGSRYAPRRDAVERCLQAIAACQKTTLDGCVIRPTANGVLIYREVEALRDVKSTLDAPWDRRWLVSGPVGPDVQIGALGKEGAQSQGNWRDAGATLERVAAHPAVWQNGTLIAAPTLTKDGKFTAKPLQRAEDFISSLYSH